MERLWAPWRMKYILSENNEDCIFCHSAAEKNNRTSLVLHKSSTCFVMMNRFPYNNGHVMVAPFRHVGHLEDLEHDESLDLMRLLQFCTKAIQSVLKPHGFNIGINVGRVAGAGVVDHIHVHVVPRWDGDTNFMPVLSETKIMNEELEHTYDKLLEGFSF